MTLSNSVETPRLRPHLDVLEDVWNSFHFNMDIFSWFFFQYFLCFIFCSVFSHWSVSTQLWVELWALRIKNADLNLNLTHLRTAVCVFTASNAKSSAVCGSLVALECICLQRRPKCFDFRGQSVSGIRSLVGGLWCERSVGFELTWHSVDGSQRPQHTNRPHGGKADVLQVEGVLQHPAAHGEKEGKWV